MSRDRQDTATEAIRELSEVAEDAVGRMAPCSARELAAERATRRPSWRAPAGVGIVAATALLLITGTLGILSEGPETEGEIPAEVLALVDSLYSSEDFVTGELASFYAPQRASEEGGEYLDQVWDTLSGSKE